ncbi:hypothetical protein F0L17_14335 [Streptomyces sp. TRM43335]|uniref:Uncharacterized protein n=1 Tax=Streptomyces taklimakanensis TaxID=2569853 RepID=A0A6G2BDA3_9ACTN|nr:hypothetical protein [Streptomyces taklimakanensis]MTE20265.1 hypothetical protein [Streptomyces taklimakanensis]
MARCGCGGSCGCAVAAGENVTITGSGSQANPWIIHAGTDCADVRACLSGGQGIDYEPATGVVRTCLSTDPDNRLVYGTDGCLHVPPQPVTCDEVRPCLSASNGATYDPATGEIGTCLSVDAGNRLVYGTDGCLHAPPVSCDEVRPCLSAGPGATYDPATGEIGTCLSADAGNNITYGSDGCLYVPTGAATVTTGCGVTGDGSASAPVAVNAGTWPYPCDIATSGGVIACDPATGQLYSEPRGQATFRSFNDERTYNNLPVPAAADTPVDTFTASITNPSTCRPALVVVTQETDVYMTLPPGSQAAWGQGGDEFSRTYNTGSSTMGNYHAQSMKHYAATANLAPGATYTHSYDVTMGHGAGGSTYYRIFSNIRFLVISL